MKNKVIEIPILNDEYKVIVCWGDRKFINRVGKNYFYEDTEICLRDKDRGTCWTNPLNHPIIVLPKSPKTPIEIGTLAHEALHAVWNIFNKINNPNDKLNDEVLGHSVGAIVRGVLKTK